MRATIVVGCVVYAILYPFVISQFRGRNTAWRPMIFLNTSFAYPAILSVVYFPALWLERELCGTDVCIVYDPHFLHQVNQRLAVPWPGYRRGADDLP